MTWLGIWGKEIFLGSRTSEMKVNRNIKALQGDRTAHRHYTWGERPRMRGKGVLMFQEGKVESGDCLGQ